MTRAATKRFLKHWIDVTVKGGTMKAPTLARAIEERVSDELGAKDGKLTSELRAYAKALAAKERTAEKKWKARTMNDAIDAAFDALDRAGIVTLQAAGFTMSDGWEDVNEKARAQKTRPRGAAFYHWQDLERGVADDGLFLAYGAYETNAKKRDAKAKLVGKEIASVLERFGVKTEWNGSLDKRIQILPFRWQKRRFTRAPKV